MKNLQINEDYERIHLTDFVYLQEEAMLMQEEVNKEINRKPALIFILDEDNILNSKEHEHQHNTLPF
jgi:hypothetical protein